jgi:glycosyltransferase involved in cell wall biosynthesis
MAAGVVNSLVAAGVDAVAVISHTDVDSARSLWPRIPLFPIVQTQEFALSRAWQWPVAARAYRQTRGFPWTIDLVHSLEAYPAGLVGSWIARAQQVPHVISAVGTYSVKATHSWLDGRHYRRTLESAAAICPISEATSRAVRLHAGASLDAAKFTTVLLGTDVPARVPRSTAAGKQRQAPPIVLSVGAVKPRKGYHDSLAAFAVVQQRWPAAEYWIVGSLSDRRYVGELRRFVAAHDLRVRFLGTVDDAQLDTAYRRAWVFVLTPIQVGSTFEGFGLVYLEAGAFGLPVVGTRSGGVTQAVLDGTTGILAASGDVAAIAAAMTELLADEIRARQLGMGNRDHAERLTWGRYAEQQLSVYEHVMSVHGATRSANLASP